MFDLSDQARPACDSQTSGKGSNFGRSLVGKNIHQKLKYGEVKWEEKIDEDYQETKELADTIPLLTIFKKYGIPCNQTNHTIRCPFKDHKGGRENTGSFKYFHETNSFYCYGCRRGSKVAHATYFVSLMEGVSTYKAAQKIIEIFNNDLGDVNYDGEVINQDERLQLMLDFSQTMREFLQLHSEESALLYAEEAAQVIDLWHLKEFEINNEALARLIEHGKEYIKNYRKL